MERLPLNLIRDAEARATENLISDGGVAAIPTLRGEERIRGNIYRDEQHHYIDASFHPLLLQYVFVPSH